MRKNRRSGCLSSLFWLLVMTGAIFIMPPFLMEKLLDIVNHEEIKFSHLLVGWWTTVAFCMAAVITKGLSRQKNKKDNE